MAEPLAGATTLDQPALEAWGEAVGRGVARGDTPLPLVIALRGPLGAGKSVLARAVARGAGVRGPMPSPTYNLLFTYEAAGGEGGGEGGIAVHHLDLYRLEDPEDVWELGWRELGEGAQVVMVEWPERAEALLPPDRWDVALAPVDGRPDRRAVRVERKGAAPEAPPLEAPGRGAAAAGRVGGPGRAGAPGRGEGRA